jgi:hypothetical protein
VAIRRRVNALRCPAGAAPAAGHLYLSEPDAGTVVRFPLTNGIPAPIPDAVIGGFSRPFGITLDALGRLYVVDTGTRTVDVFTTIPKKGAYPAYVLPLPRGNNYRSVAVDRLGWVYVSYATPCNEVVLCDSIAVYAPPPFTTAKPYGYYYEFGGDIAPRLAVDGLGQRMTLVYGGILGLAHDVPAGLSQVDFLPCFTTYALVAAWGPGNTIYEAMANTSPAEIYVLPDYKNSPCTNFEVIRSATLPLYQPLGMAQSGGRLYVTSAYTLAHGYGHIFTFDATKFGSQVPLSIIGGPGSAVTSPYALAVGR